MLKRFVNLHMRLAQVGQIYTIFIPVPLISGKELIIKVIDEVTLNYVLDCAMSGHVRVVRFYIILQPAEEGHGKEY